MTQEFIKDHAGHKAGDVVDNLGHTTFIKLGITRPVPAKKENAKDNTVKENAKS